ncbi:MAG: CDP-alcohol phosphatidyltransferase family protein [Pseudomonadota bacterium]
MTDDVENRRPIAARNTGPAQRVARALAATGVSANGISVASVMFAALAAAAFLLAGPLGPMVLFVVPVAVALRLAANLFDGMVAVEHGKGTATGPLYNEVPDRIADVLVLAAMGSASGALGSGLVASLGPGLGWLAAVLALLTAYVRELGRALGQPADFSGPLAKQQRMWVAGGAALITAFEGAWGGAGEVLFAGLVVLVVGTGVTVARRLKRLAGALGA